MEVAAERHDPAGTLARAAAALFAITALYSGVAQYVEAALHGPKPLYAIVAVVGAGILFLALDPHRPTTVLRSPLLLWIYGFLFMTLIWGVVRFSYSSDTAQGLVDRFRSMAFLAAMAILFDDRVSREYGRRAVAAVAVLSSIVNVAQAIGLLAFDDGLRRAAGRAAGLYVNANGAGLIIVLGLAAGLTGLPKALRVAALAIGAAGVFVTFSRGSLVCFAVAVAILFWQREVPRWALALIAIAALPAIALTLHQIQQALATGGALNEDTLARLSMTADDSGRAKLAARAWQAWLEAPWFGHGVATHPASRVAHNMYLSLASEHGVLGFVLLPALALAIVVRNRAGLATAAVLLLAGFMSHNLFDAEPILLCVALAAAAPLESPGAVEAPPTAAAADEYASEV